MSECKPTPLSECKQSLRDCSTRSHAWRRIAVWAVLIGIILILIPAAWRGDTEKKSALRIAEYMSLIDTAVVVVDGDMNIENFSAGAEKLFGVNRESVIGRSMIWMVPPVMRAEHTAAWRKWWKGDDTTRKVVQCIGQDYAGQPLELVMRIDAVIAPDKRWKAVVQVERQRPTDEVKVMPR